MTRYATPRSCVRSSVRSCVRPITGVSGIDSDAAAYIAALEGDGVSVSSVQSSALNDFYTTGKSEGWYSSLKRIYLPIWAAASPNARCMVSGTSGTFVGGMTHGAGFVKGNASTGYFNTQSSPSALGQTTADFAFGVLCKAPDTGTGTPSYMGAFDSSVNVYQLIFVDSGSNDLNVKSNDVSRDSFSGVDRADTAGIWFASRDAGTDYLIQRTSSGNFLRVSNTRATAGTPPTIPMFCMARHNSGVSADLLTDGEFGAFFMGLSIPQAEANNFAAALETLWETCTALTLP